MVKDSPQRQGQFHHKSQFLMIIDLASHVVMSGDIPSEILSWQDITTKNFNLF